MLRRSVLVGGLVLVLSASVASAQQPRGQGRGGFGGPGGFQGSPAMLLGVPEVQKELGLNDDQKKQLEQLVSDLQEEMQASFANFNFQEIQNLSQEEREKRFGEARKKAE